MKEELIKFHNINENKIFEIGSPQFDYYLNNKIQNENLVEFYKIKDPKSIKGFGVFFLPFL